MKILQHLNFFFYNVYENNSKVCSLYFFAFKHYCDESKSSLNQVNLQDCHHGLQKKVKLFTFVPNVLRLFGLCLFFPVLCLDVYCSFQLSISLSVFSLLHPYLANQIKQTAWQLSVSADLSLPVQCECSSTQLCWKSDLLSCLIIVFTQFYSVPHDRINTSETL